MDTTPQQATAKASPHNNCGVGGPHQGGRDNGSSGGLRNAGVVSSNRTATRYRTPKHSVHWFRKGLRLSDNPALLRAIKHCDTWRCVFILDPWFAGTSNQGVNKWR